MSNRRVCSPRSHQKICLSPGEHIILCPKKGQKRICKDFSLLPALLMHVATPSTVLGSGRRGQTGGVHAALHSVWGIVFNWPRTDQAGHRSPPPLPARRVRLPTLFTAAHFQHPLDAARHCLLLPSSRLRWGGTCRGLSNGPVFVAIIDLKTAVGPCVHGAHGHTRWPMCTTLMCVY